MTPAPTIIIAFIAAIAFFALSWKAGGVWIRRNIPLPEDHPKGAAGEARMIAEFERIRKIHEAQRAQNKKRVADAHRADPLNFDDCA